MTTKTIQLQQLSKIHGKYIVLKNISIQTQEGKVTAFLGPNGVGKNSTLQI